MYVSVVICTHSMDNYRNLIEAVDSILAQTYKDKNIIVVVDGNHKLYERFLSDHGVNGVVKTVLLEENAGISEARNAGVRVATGDAIAFIDDDATAAREWLENLVDTYSEFDALAVGGKILPVWMGKKPDFLPEELYWLVGVDYSDPPENKAIEVRNVFGPNMSFRKEVFEKIGFFNKDLGFAKRNTAYLQAEEADLSLRMKQAFGKGVIYNPQAEVFHKVPPDKVKVITLLKRAYYQGYSKALLRKYHNSTGSIAIEKSYLKTSVTKYIPQRLKRAYHLTELKKVSMLLVTIISVILGFAYGSVQQGFPMLKNKLGPQQSQH
jgi:glucosyl-dolichyl phosphate glucuronosyltransferase